MARREIFRPLRDPGRKWFCRSEVPEFLNPTKEHGSIQPQSGGKDAFDSSSVPKLTPARRLCTGEGIERPDPSAQLCDSAHPWNSHVQKVRAGFLWEDRSIA